MNLTIRPMTPAERKYAYNQSQQLACQTSCIGHLRADFGSGGDGFYSSWNYIDKLPAQFFPKNMWYSYQKIEFDRNTDERPWEFHNEPPKYR